VRDDVAQDTSGKIKTLLIGLHNSEVGRSLLKGIDTREFVSANDEDFDVVRQFLKEYNAKVKKKP
jgi:ABC-type phosphate/phosphonate transport system substrate-binding protein